MAATVEAKRFAAKVVRRLVREYPEAQCSLDFTTPLELLIATILSAQCTDQRVNRVTKDLFKRYRTAKDYASAPLEQLKDDIRSTGFFNNKATNIQACCRQLVERHRSRVPKDMDPLVELPGIGRKTANVVLGTAFEIATGVVVDTHVGRISRRLGLTDQKTPEKIEQDLIAVLPQKEWVAFSHRMVQHGRRICAARKPLCDECPLGDICPRLARHPSG